MTMSDRIFVLNHGELQQADTPDAIYNEPINRFVADFIGSPSMNFYDVEFTGSAFVSDAFRYEAPANVQETVADSLSDDVCTLGVRPEHITLVKAGSGIDATVEVVEQAGSDNFVYLDLDGAECRVRVPGDVRPSVGSTVGVEFDDDRIHVFDPKDGRNVLYGTRRREISQVQ